STSASWCRRRAARSIFLRSPVTIEGESITFRGRGRSDSRGDPNVREKETTKKMDLSARFLSLALGGAGWVLWLLVMLSVISLAISLERLWYFRTHRVQKATLLADMQALVRESASGDGDREV